MKLFRTKNINVTLLGLTLSVLVIDRLWGFIFTNTIFQSVSVVYFSFLLLLFMFVCVWVRYGLGNITKLSFVWIPYLLYTIFGYGIQLSFQNVAYWLICLILVLVAARKNIVETIPVKILFLSGVIALIGIFFQILFPDFYSANVLPLFTSDDIMERWSESYGFAGFTYQLGHTAKLLIYAEICLLFLNDRILPTKFNKPVLKYFFLALIIVGVFLTGKRFLSALSISLPIIITFFTKSTRKNILIFVLSVFIGCAFFEYFINNIDRFAESSLFRRFASTYLDLQSGSDISSGRSFLYESALKLFYSNPILGIGVGEFQEFSGESTSVHNTYLQVLCEQGIVGFVFYVVPIIYILISTIIYYRKCPVGYYRPYYGFSLSIQLYYFFYAFTGNENTGAGFVMYFIAVSLLISLRTINRQNLLPLTK